ncbi:hypothetical protein DSO57_1039416 [Entomophthora muscae]|uniref:Uncharacterized protein n=1 Tax=Entomophthora muscae TaxID=34485 RepID=A0ACC2RPC3_9FUNG|nr:hypothetical protein DSO57_1039416 [Entomophthora muscae]
MEVEYWMHRCSICFDANQELCLNRCRDQFCRDCFNRYVKEVVNNSWGLNVTKIKCPVCQDPLPILEWSKHVDPEIVALYNTYNQPYRSVTRCCGNCGEVVYSAKVETDLSEEEKFEYLEAIFTDCRFLLEESNTSATNINHFLNNLEFDYRYFLSGRTSGGIEIYRRTINRLLKAISSSGLRRDSRENLMDLAANISSRLIAIELKPEIWKELQFEHIVRFPTVTCQSCQSPSCLKCATPNHHSGLTCLDFMRKQLEAGIGSPEKLENIRWTLDNSKSCPHCQILINRDDGCNRVDCLYCGFRFCWICLSAWSEKCGFYQCQETPQLPNGETAFDNGAPSDKPELGIPDVASIEAKLWNMT